MWFSQTQKKYSGSEKNMRFKKKQSAPLTTHMIYISLFFLYYLVKSVFETSVKFTLCFGSMKISSLKHLFVFVLFFPNKFLNLKIFRLEKKKKSFVKLSGDIFIFQVMNTSESFSKMESIFHYKEPLKQNFFLLRKTFQLIDKAIPLTERNDLHKI